MAITRNEQCQPRLGLGGDATNLLDDAEIFVVSDGEGEEEVNPSKNV